MAKVQPQERVYWPVVELLSAFWTCALLITALYNTTKQYKSSDCPYSLFLFLSFSLFPSLPFVFGQPRGLGFEGGRVAEEDDAVLGSRGPVACGYGGWVCVERWQR